MYLSRYYTCQIMPTTNWLLQDLLAYSRGYLKDGHGLWFQKCSSAGLQKDRGGYKWKNDPSLCDSTKYLISHNGQHLQHC
jgi:hypothetical protein